MIFSSLGCGSVLSACCFFQPADTDTYICGTCIHMSDLAARGLKARACFFLALAFGTATVGCALHILTIDISHVPVVEMRTTRLALIPSLNVSFGSELDERGLLHESRATAVGSSLRAARTILLV